MRSKFLYHIKPVLNSYAILFFSQNSILGVLLLMVSFFNLFAGLTGLFCVLLSLLVVHLMGYHRDYIRMGLYSFNALIFGLAFAMFYQFNIAFCLWLTIASLITIVFSIILSAWLGKYNLPILSLPFIVTYWLVMLAQAGYGGIGLIPKDGLLLNQLFFLCHNHLFSSSGLLTGFQFPYFIDLFFRSLSAIIFQDSVVAGIFIAIGIFIHSRISFSLLIIGFISACIFNKFTGAQADSYSYYNLGANFMMISAAVGSFFLIPSARSYFLAVISIPASYLLINALSRLLGIYNLPVFSLPFCLITLSVLYFFILRIIPGKLQLTPLQHYSPEKNLYQYLNNVSRLDSLKYSRISLPFMGAWTVSQGYNGNITHTGDWGEAIDFVIEDDGKKTYDNTGTLPEHFYCFSKPVLACADGVVVNVIDNVEDNVIGEINTIQNWGNTVIIKHLDGLYSKVSHLKKHSVKIKPGDAVKQGDLLGLCGNSGRSPEPHLHFQLQGAPYIGAKTLKYPFADYIGYDKNEHGKYFAYSIPDERMIVKPAEINTALKHAFAFEPGYYSRIKTPRGKQETWEVFSDVYNGQYLYSNETQSSAYFINNGSCFYFTAFYGDEGSLLYYFYLSAYKVNFNTTDPGVIDTFTLQTGNNMRLWLYDLAAPFYRFIKHTYTNKCETGREGIIIKACKEHCLFNTCKPMMDAEINISNNKLKSLKIKLNEKVIEAQWDTGNT